jgi:flagellin
MALSIATNTGALMAAASASSVNKDMETSMERLSTGKRINSASDDAAGVAIASRLTSEIKGTNQAIRNAQDAQGLINTAEGAHKEVENILQRMRELAVQASNDTNGASDRTAMAAELTQLTSEIDRVAATTTWAGTSLLNGGATEGTVNTVADTAQTFDFQIATNTAGTGDTLSVAIKDIGSLSLGINGIGSGATVTASETSNAAAFPSISTNTLVTDGGFSISIASGTGTITATKADAAPTAVSKDTVTITVDGTAVAFDAFTDGVEKGFEVTTDVGMSAAINSKLSENAALAAKGITFTDNAGDGDLVVTKAGAANTATVSDIAEGGGGARAGGAAAVNYDAYTKVAIADFTANETITLNIEGVDVAITTSTTDGFADSRQGTVDQMVQAINDAGISGITASSDTNFLKISKSNSVDVSSNANAQSAIAAIDGAISELNTQRASLGASSNRLDSTVSNLTNIAINLEGGRGRIEDADFAAESTSLAKSQILQQASTAMLAQANASKQNVLSLLQG